MTTTQALKMREIPPQMRARLAAAGAACAAAPEADKTRHIAEIDAITDDWPAWASCTAAAPSARSSARPAGHRVPADPTHAETRP